MPAWPSSPRALTYAAGEWLHGAGIATCGRHPRLILGRVGPAGHGHELDQRIPMAEGGLVVTHLGDRAAIALQAAGRQHRQVAVAAGAPSQEGVDRAVAELAQEMALPVAAQPMALLLVLEALQLQVAQLLDPLGQRRRARAQGRQ